MAGEEIFELVGDASSYEDAMSKVEAWAKKAGIALSNWTKSTEEANRGAKSTSITLQAMTDTLDKLTIAISKNQKGLSVNSVTLEDGTQRRVKAAADTARAETKSYEDSLDAGKKFEQSVEQILAKRWQAELNLKQKISDLRGQQASENQQALADYFRQIEANVTSNLRLQEYNARQQSLIMEQEATKLKAIGDREFADFEKRLMAEGKLKEQTARQQQQIIEEDAARAQADSDKQGDKNNTFLKQAFYANVYARALSFVASNLREANKAAIDFDRQTSRIQMQTGLANVGQSSFSVAKQFNQNPGDVAASISRAATSGLGVPIEVATQGAALGQLTGTGAAAATDALVASLRAYDIEGGKAAEVAALLAQAWQKGIEPNTELGGSIGRTALIARTMGVTLSEHLSLLEAFKQHSIDAAQAGQIMDNVFSRLSNPSEVLKQKFADLGRTTAQGVIEQYGLSKALQAVFEDTTNTNDVLDAFKSTLGGGKTALLEFTGIVQEYIRNSKEAAGSTKDFKDKVDEIGSGSGEGLSSWWNSIKVTFQELLQFAQNTVAPGSSLDQIKFQNWKKKNWTPKKDFFGGENAADNDEAYQAYKLSQDLETLRTKNAEAQRKDFADRTEGFKSHEKAMQVEAIKWNQTQRDLEKIATEDFKSELEIRFRRYEDKVHQETEIADRAKTLRKASVGRVEELKDSVGAGTYQRQLSLLSPQQRDAASLASISGQYYNVSSPYGDLGNPIQRHIANLESQRQSLYKGATDKTGDAFLESKDIDRAVAKTKELGTIYQEQFTTVVQLYQQRKASAEDVMNAERKITENAQEQVDLEQQLQSALTAKEKASKAAADAEKKKVADTKNAVMGALGVSFLNDKGEKNFESKEEMTRKFDAFAQQAKTGAGNAGELIQIVKMLDERKAQILKTAGREEARAAVEGKATTASEAQKDNERYAETRTKEQVDVGVTVMKRVWEGVETAIAEFLNQKLGKTTKGEPKMNLGGYGGSGLPGMGLPQMGRDWSKTPDPSFTPSVKPTEAASSSASAAGANGSVVHAGDVVVNIAPGGYLSGDDMTKLLDAMRRLERQQRKGDQN